MRGEDRVPPDCPGWSTSRSASRTWPGPGSWGGGGGSSWPPAPLPGPAAPAPARAARPWTKDKPVIGQLWKHPYIVHTTQQGRPSYEHWLLKTHYRLHYILRNYWRAWKKPGSLGAGLAAARPSESSHTISQRPKACCVAQGPLFERHVTFSQRQDLILHRKTCILRRPENYLAAASEMRLAAATRVSFHVWLLVTKTYSELWQFNASANCFGDIMN